MSWDGYYRFGDVEIINAARVRAYADALGMPWVKDAGTGKNPEGLAALLGDTYIKPSVDPAPWYDNDIPESGDFAGVLPLEVNGIENSTRESTVFEFTHDGGNPGKLRESTKAVVFSVALVGLTEASVEYGMRWLKRALRRRDCSPGSTVSCRGERLVYARHAPDERLSAAESADDGVPTQEWETGYERHLNDVLVNRGPVINNKRTLPGCNGVVWLVSFTAVAGDPYEYGNASLVLEDMISNINAGQSPWPGGVGSYGQTTYPYTTCPTVVSTPIFDPTFSPFTPPPQAPDLMPSGFVFPSGTQNRMYADIPASLVPEWDEVRPLIVLTGGSQDHRMIRIRFFVEGVATTINCGGEIGEYIVSYLPADMTLVIDTAQEAVYAYGSNGVVRRADSLVFGTNARPITWFGLSCGGGSMMAVDSDDPLTDFDLSLSFVPRSA